MDLIMTVNPGFGASERYQGNSRSKISLLSNLKKDKRVTLWKLNRLVGFLLRQLNRKNAGLAKFFVYSSYII